MSFTEAADTVKAGLDVVEVVSRHVALKRAGRNHLGLCPFHAEKTPSFNVNREKGFYKCFGCGEGGDALGFLMKVERKTYAEVIRSLAEAQGIVIAEAYQRPDEAAQQRVERERIQQLMDAALSWYQDQFWGEAGTPAREYLERRTLPEELIHTYGLGFAPPGWEGLTRHLLQHYDWLQASPDLLVTAGLATSRSEGHGFYDRFRNRLIIPIYDENGRLVAFGGRALSDEDTPKYLNSPETPLYVKSRVLYALNTAREGIRQHKQAILMEGYFDVLRAHAAGLTHAVATCGTALTDTHLKRLTREGVETLYLAFDADPAGQKAARSAITLIEQAAEALHLSLRVVVVPDGKDPDDFIRTHGGPAFAQLMAVAPSFLSFQLDSALQAIPDSFRPNTPEYRVEAANRLSPLLANIQHPVLRQETLRRYADRLGIGEDALQLAVTALAPKQAILPMPPSSLKRPDYKTRSKPKPRQWSSLPSPAPVGRRQAAERTLLALTFAFEEAPVTLAPALNTTDWNDPAHARLAEAVSTLASAGDALATLLPRLRDTLDPADHPLLADLSFAGDSLADRLGWGDLGPVGLKERLLAEAGQLQNLLTAEVCHEHLVDLARSMKGLETGQGKAYAGLGPDASPPPTGGVSSGPDPSDEGSVLALQYQLRDQLRQRRLQRAQPPGAQTPPSA